jgi:plasmid stabilization system protein ParE
MARAHKSRPAERDLDEIAAFIARDSVDAALRWLAEVDEFFQRSAAAPGMERRTTASAKVCAASRLEAILCSFAEFVAESKLFG